MPPPPAPGAQARAGKPKPKSASAQIKKKPKKAESALDSTDAEQRAGSEAGSVAFSRAANTKNITSKVMIADEAKRNLAWLHIGMMR